MSEDRSPPTPADGLPLPQRYRAVLTVVLALTMAVLDGSITNIALPTIGHDLGARPESAIWVVNAYQLAMTVTLLPLAALGEIVEYRRIYLAGLALFTVGSLACALSGSLVALVLARVVQGLGAAGIVSVNAALIRFIFPRRRLGRGMSINTLVVALAAAAGPTVAAFILAAAHWQWLFLVNVPIGVVALVVAQGALPQSPRAGHRFDMKSALLNALAIGALIGAIDATAHRRRSEVIAVGFAVGAGLGWRLVRRELGQPWPVVPVDLLRIRLFTLSLATSLCSFTAQMLAYVGLPYFFQDRLGLSQVATGLMMTPWPLAVALVAPLSGRLTDRHPPGLLCGIGLGIFGLGLALMALLPNAPTIPDIAWRMALCGIGFGIFQTPNNRGIVAAAPPERSGGASGMLAAARLMGQTMGAALAALMFALSPLHGSIRALALAAAIAALAAAVSLTRFAGGTGQPAPTAPPLSFDA